MGKSLTGRLKKDLEKIEMSAGYTYSRTKVAISRVYCWVSPAPK